MGARRFSLISAVALSWATAALHGSITAPVLSAGVAAPLVAATPELLASGLEGASGSAIGPGGALFVTEGTAGRITRIDPQTGARSTFASGLPPSLIGLGGVVDVAFYGSTAYALVTLVGPEVGGTAQNGIYRVDGPSDFTLIADLGAFSVANPPATQFDVATGLQFAIETFRGGFLVTDGHLNRVLRVTRQGAISVFKAFDNIVPTGLAVAGNRVYMGEAGPIPHLPEDGRIVMFGPKSAAVTLIAAGAPLLVDVEFGRAHDLYGLSQGIWPLGGPPASPALPNTGALMKVTAGGGFVPVVEGLNQPTSVEFIGTTAYVVTLGGEVWRIEGVN